MALMRADAVRAAMLPMANRRKPMSRDRKVGLFLLVPLVLLVFGLTVYPIIQVIQLAFKQQSLYSQEATIVGLANFEAVVNHEGFGRSVKNTFVFTFGSLAFQSGDSNLYTRGLAKRWFAGNGCAGD